MSVTESIDMVLPEGFSHREDFLTIEEENDLLERFQRLNFHPFDFHGYTAKRRIVEYGFEYDFTSRRANATQSIPDFMTPYTMRAAQWAGIVPHEIVEAVITLYPEGAPIGWHGNISTASQPFGRAGTRSHSVQVGGRKKGPEVFSGPACLSARWKPARRRPRLAVDR
jgi:alkylated DNA repair dioxygenase AlkB